jgi:hypothetical protein
MQVGWQFNGACTFMVMDADSGACGQTLRIAQFGVSYQGILVCYTYCHLLACQIPGAISSEFCGKSVVCQQNSCYE